MSLPNMAKHGTVPIPVHRNRGILRSLVFACILSIDGPKILTYQEKLKSSVLLTFLSVFPRREKKLGSQCPILFCLASTLLPVIRRGSNLYRSMALFFISSIHHPLPISSTSTSYSIIYTLMILSCIYLLKLTVADCLSLAKRRVECCVNDIDCWMVHINQDKTELGFISSKFRSRPSLEFIQVGDEKIQPKSTARNLGVTIDQCLDLTDPVKKICVSWVKVKNPIPCQRVDNYLIL